jgi:AcrR family transcriptional regulator
MTQEADRSPAQAGAGAVRESARPETPSPTVLPAATSGAGQQHSPDAAGGAGPTPGAGQGHSASQGNSAGQAHGSGRRSAGSRTARKPQGRPSLGGGTPAQDRELRAQGRETVRKLLEAGMIEFEERGFGGVRVDDVVKRAGISHGTFYLYFANKEDLFKALLRDALHDMEIVAGDFPVVTSDDTGLSVLRRWVRKFFAAYAAHATVIRILSSADLVPDEVYSDGLQLFFSIAEAMTTGMTAAAEAAGRHHESPELTAVACLMMLERVNYLISTEVQLPVPEMSDKIADIMFAAFGLVVA